MQLLYPELVLRKYIRVSTVLQVKGHKRCFLLKSKTQNVKGFFGVVRTRTGKSTRYAVTVRAENINCCCGEQWGF